MDGTLNQLNALQQVARDAPLLQITEALDKAVENCHMAADVLAKKLEPLRDKRDDADTTDPSQPFGSSTTVSHLESIYRRMISLEIKLGSITAHTEV